MSREATERVTGRLYQHQLKTTGRLPTGKESRVMEKRAQKIAREMDNKRKYEKS